MSETSQLASGASPTILAGAARTQLDGASFSLPADYGFKVWNHPVPLISSTRPAVAGFVEGAKLWIRKTDTFSTMYVIQTVAATVNSNCYMCLYDSSGNRIGGTPVDQSTDWQTSTAGSLKPIAIPSPVTLTAGTFVWVALLCGAATTKPSFARFLQSSYLIGNVNLTAATSNSGALTGGSQTSMPTTITPSSINQNYNADPFWCALA